MKPRSAVLIGAYGGDHVGDAAILGGVLLRLAQQERIERAVVASFRPERTRRLVALIRPVIPVEVIAYGPTPLHAHLRRADLLLWAGGPLADHPRMLARNLVTVLLARARGVPFALEGVGIRPSFMWISERMVRETLRLAESISVRSTASARRAKRLSGRDCRVTSDPAFDYLATRSTVDLVTPDERERIDSFTARPAGTLLIGLNARPKKPNMSRRDYSMALERLALGLTGFAERRAVRYVFFPLESEANTGADLEAGAELGRYLRPDIDFRVWEEQPGIDGILSLLRAADAAVTMRLHASIFALSQQLPTVGIDRSGEKRGKVGELFDDLGAGDRALSFADLDSEALIRTLTGVIHDPAPL